MPSDVDMKPVMNVHLSNFVAGAVMTKIREQWRRRQQRTRYIEEGTTERGNYDTWQRRATEPDRGNNSRGGGTSRETQPDDVTAVDHNSDGIGCLEPGGDGGWMRCGRLRAECPTAQAARMESRMSKPFSLVVGFLFCPRGNDRGRVCTGGSLGPSPLNFNVDLNQYQ